MTWTRGTLADFLGDLVVYRNLEPMDPRIPGLRASWASLGMDHYYVPRKTTPEYSVALVAYLKHAQAVRGVATPLAHALFIGDTLMNDGTAARNVAEHYPLMGFIGSDRLDDPAESGDLGYGNQSFTDLFRRFELERAAIHKWVMPSNGARN